MPCLGASFGSKPWSQCPTSSLQEYCLVHNVDWMDFILVPSLLFFCRVLHQSYQKDQRK